MINYHNVGVEYIYIVIGMSCELKQVGVVLIYSVLFMYSIIDQLNLRQARMLLLPAITRSISTLYNQYLAEEKENLALALHGTCFLAQEDTVEATRPTENMVWWVGRLNAGPRLKSRFLGPVQTLGPISTKFTKVEKFIF